jgi:hypothetical protein
MKDSVNDRFVDSANRVGVFARLAYQFTSSTAWIWNSVVWPTIRVVRWPIKKLFRGYVRFVWNKLAKKDGQFSNVRGGLTLLGTGLFSYFLLLPFLGLLWDTGLYFATGKVDEEIYLTNSQEIDPVENVHSIQGCEDLPCSEGNSVYFRVEGSLFNEVHSVLTNGSLYYPDYVAGAVPPVVSKCKVTSYGFRMRFLRRNLDVFPKMIHSSCAPVSGNR